MKKLRTAPLSPKSNLPLSEVVVYAPKRWDQMSLKERTFVRHVHEALSDGMNFRIEQREDGDWVIEYEAENTTEQDENEQKETRRNTAWWPRSAPGFVTMTLAGGQFRNEPANGWWTFVIAAYSEREAYHLAALGEWAPDAFTPGIRRMFQASGAVVLGPNV